MRYSSDSIGVFPFFCQLSAFSLSFSRSSGFLMSTICGVMMITISVSSTAVSVFLKSLPMNGMSPKIGSLFSTCFCFLRMIPPTTNLLTVFNINIDADSVIIGNRCVEISKLNEVTGTDILNVQSDRPLAVLAHL